MFDPIFSLLSVHPLKNSMKGIFRPTHNYKNYLADQLEKIESVKNLNLSYGIQTKEPIFISIPTGSLIKSKGQIKSK